MLGNRIGYGVLKGCTEKGILNGPKHIGCNDQEHNRSGVAAYMTEQKLRETDLRCFQGGLEDAQAWPSWWHSTASALPTLPIMWV